MKILVYVWPTIYLQRREHQWTQTMIEPCSYLNFAQISPCKTLSKYGAHSQIRPGTNLSTFSFERMMYSKIYARYHANHQLSKVTAHQTQNIEKILHFQRQMGGKCWEIYLQLIDLLTIWYLKVGGQCLKWDLLNDVWQHRPYLSWDSPFKFNNKRVVSKKWVPRVTLGLQHWRPKEVCRVFHT